MKSATNRKSEQKARRQARIRAKVSGTAEKPRLSVFKSNTKLELQLIDDSKGVTIAAASTAGVKGKGLVEKAFAAGKALAGKAVAAKVDRAVFDRGGYIYIGAVKAAADGAREGGLKF